jgi:hypothetical protein
VSTGHFRRRTGKARAADGRRRRVDAYGTVKGRLRRWFWAQESPTDDLVGGGIAAVVIALLFRFGFGDSWSFALGAGVFAFLMSVGFSRRGRDRRASRRAGS